MKHVEIHVAELLGENEAILKVVDEGISLFVYSYPYSPSFVFSDIVLFSFLTENIMKEEVFSPPKQIDGIFSYHITAKVVNTSANLVAINGIKIILDTPLPKDIANGSIVSFDVTRLDL